jgi:exodeoxyribonuclease-3
MRVATFNCNSVRARLPILLGWLEAHRPDAVALQETKVADAAFPETAFRDAGWEVVYRGEKGYNGVAVVSRKAPAEVVFGLGDDEGESEPRLACVRLGPVTIVNTYVPQGRALDSPHFSEKLEWFARLRRFLEARFDPERDRVLWTGDLNVAPEPKDVYDSKKVAPHVCHCDEVTEAFAAVRGWGLEDVFRKHLPEEGVFTFWDYRVRDALARNIGWRIDHMLATPRLAESSTACAVDTDPRRAERPSDHTFVYADFDL